MSKKIKLKNTSRMFMLALGYLFGSWGTSNGKHTVAFCGLALFMGIGFDISDWWIERSLRNDTPVTDVESKGDLNATAPVKSAQNNRGKS
jgi:hypothetical protein